MIERTHRPPKDFGQFREMLFEHFDSLSPHLRRIAEYALGEPNRFALQTVAEVAGETGVQPSTLVRFARAFGFSGYSELRQLFRARLLQAELSSRERRREQLQRLDGTDATDPRGKLQAFADTSISAIEELRNRIDAEALAEAVRLLGAARTIHVVGSGRVWPIGLCLSSGLVELKRAAHMLDGLAGTIAHQIDTIDNEDVLVALGSRDESPAVADAVVRARRRQVPVIAITHSDVSVIARESTVYLVVRDADVGPVPPLAAHVVLAQSLVFALHRRPRSAGTVEASEHDAG